MGEHCATGSAHGRVPPGRNAAYGPLLEFACPVDHARPEKNVAMESDPKQGSCCARTRGQEK